MADEQHVIPTSGSIIASTSPTLGDLIERKIASLQHQVTELQATKEKLQPLLGMTRGELSQLLTL